VQTKQPRERAGTLAVVRADLRVVDFRRCAATTAPAYLR
jgi:hypothetical protein